MKLNKLQIIILKALYKSEKGLEYYTLHKKYLLSPSIILDVINSLSNRGLVKLEEHRVSISDEALKIIMENPRILKISDEANWNKPLDEYMTSSINLDEKYVPKISSLDKDIKKRIEASS
jgi:predicted methyltransferase